MSAQGGQGEAIDPKADGLSPRTIAKLEYMAIAKGWLKGPDGVGLDHRKLAAIAQRNVLLSIDPNTDPRTAAACTRNVIAMVGQVMDQESRDEGGDTLNVNVNGTLTVEQRDREIAAICTAALERAGKGASTQSANGNGNGQH